VHTIIEHLRSVAMSYFGSTPPDIKLIICSKCDMHRVETNISKVPGPNHYKRFYKCPDNEVC
jgi:hypothetical protein